MSRTRSTHRHPHVRHGSLIAIRNQGSFPELGYGRLWMVLKVDRSALLPTSMFDPGLNAFGGCWYGRKDIMSFTSYGKVLSLKGIHPSDVIIVRHVDDEDLGHRASMRWLRKALS